MLEELRKKQTELRRQLSEVTGQIREEKLRMVEAQYGVKIGSIVVNNKGIEHRVVNIETGVGKRPWLEGVPRKKNLEFGTARRNLYSEWTLVQADEGEKC